MPFITVVTLGAPASELITTVVEIEDNQTTLKSIKAVCDTEFCDTLCTSPGKANCSMTLTEKTVPPASESGYSSASSSNSSACSLTSFNEHNKSFMCGADAGESNSRNLSEIPSKDQNYGTSFHPLNFESCNQSPANSSCVPSNLGITTQSKATLWKTWIRNKLNLTKNGKYSFEGNLVRFSHYGFRVNKSLLVECTSDTPYSQIKAFTLVQTPNDECKIDLTACGDTTNHQEHINLLVRECLKTYCTPFYEMRLNNVLSKHNGSISTSVDHENECKLTMGEDPDTKVQRHKVPRWFWTAWSKRRGIEMDEAGSVLDGQFVVIHNGLNIGERVLQVKWDNPEERFVITIWSGGAGCDFIEKLDIEDVKPIWHSEQKMTLSDNIVLQSDPRKTSLRDLFILCAEVGCYQRSTELASLKNVERVRDIVHLFQRAAALGLIMNGRSWTKVRIKVDTVSDKEKQSAQPTTSFTHPTNFDVRLDSIEFRLKTETGANVEPYFLTMCIYDVKNGRKISEDFHATTDSSGKVLSKKAHFHVSDPNDQVFAILRVEKTLHAVDFDAYLRGNPDPKNGSRISRSVLTSPLFKEGPLYRMPLCWSACCLFKSCSTTSTISYILDPESSFSSFYKYDKYSDDEMLRILMDFKKIEKMAKLSVVPGTIKAEISSSQHNNAKQDGLDESSPTSVVEFPTQSSRNFSNFTHFLYVYPFNLNLNGVTGKIRARNILCRVFLRSDDDIDASPLDHSFQDGSIATFVLHHRSNPEWYSEIKLSLPVALDPRLHVLFQFYHISCSFDKANKMKQVENLVGYSWTPLLSKYRFIGHEHTLPIASTLPSGYLQIQPLGLGKGFAGPDIVWLDKCTLNVKLQLMSTVWTKCACLGAFFANTEKLFPRSSFKGKFHCDDENIVKSMRGLETIDVSTLRDFFPTIINQICTVCGTSKSVGNASLRFLIFAFRSLCEAKMGVIIDDYIRLRFLSTCVQKDGEVQKFVVADIILEAWIDLFETGDGSTIASSLEHSRHLFAMIVKSIAVQGFDFLNTEESKLSKLTQLFTSEVVQRCSSDHGISSEANQNFISFISELMSVITDRHIVFSALNSYLACFGPGDSHKVQDFKFALLNSLVEHPLFLELNESEDDDEFTRLDNVNWAKKHFLVATVMKQSRSGLGEVSNVRSLALKPVLTGILRQESSGNNTSIWIPWLRVVCDNLHRVSSVSLHSTHSSRCSSISTVLSSTSSTLVQAALSRTIGSHHVDHNHGSCQTRDVNHLSPHIHVSNDGLDSSSHSSTLSLNVPNGSVSHNSSMVNLSNVGMGASGQLISSAESVGSDRFSIDRMSIGSINNCDYLDAISAIKTSNPAAVVPSSAASCVSETDTIVNDQATINDSSGERSLVKHPSDDGADEEASLKPSVQGTNTDIDKSNVVLRRYDKLNDVESSQLLVSGLYLLKIIGTDRLRQFWNRSSPAERSSLLQMIHLTCAHFTNAKKNSTITRKKMVGILVPPTMPPSPRTSLLPTKKWNSLPLRTAEGESDNMDGITEGKQSSSVERVDCGNEWEALNTESTLVCVETLSELCSACKGEQNELRDIIRTTLDVAKASEDTRAILGVLNHLYKVDELAPIVFDKGNEDLCHQLFCDLLNGFGTSYLMHTCVLILMKLFSYNSTKTITKSLFAVSALSLNSVFVHNFRKALNLLKQGRPKDRSSFMMSIAENLKFIDIKDEDNTDQNTHVSSSTNNNPTSNNLSCPATEDRSSVGNLADRLATILNSLWLLKSCSNDYKFTELHLKLANAYGHFGRARLRMEMFDALKINHLNKKRYTEALMCELHVAARLARRNATPEVRKIMLGLSKNLEQEFADVDNEQLEEEEETTEELIQKLENCVHLSEKAERYELMLEIYRILVDIQESLSDYAALEHSYKQMAKACALIQNKRERFLGTYFRVALYRPIVSKTSLTRPVDAFVYKEPNVTTLQEIVAKVEAAESATIISGDLESMPDDENVYATITVLAPIPSESPRRKIWSEDFRRHQNVNKFSYDTPFAIKAQDKISVDNKAAVHQQWKRRTTITTEYTFPAAVCRLRIIHSEEENLSPIVVAIDDMQRRVGELRSELHTQNIKMMELKLTGSVSVYVNQGPLAYARAFFEKESDYPPQDMHRLKATFRDFVECCGELLIRNGHLITPERSDYQSQLEADYSRLCQILSPALGLPETGLNRMSRASISSY